ncbi:hypothetical protein PR202_ga14704 [Eleusine coracana subsp. coracana]|uniref:Endonuclease V n=1 Tax=Eleusine coracana subsp. coracana TaxID=191504 RepID=A0AAV5CI30_ELECO|nr:hypothetical protein PR202_ga14704 [Eleusine coracana subsp. coracana]
MDDDSGHKGEGDDHALVLQKQEWVNTQDMLKRKLVLDDDFDWSLPSAGSCSDNDDVRGKLKYVAGVDISFLKEDPSMACAAVVVLDASTLEVVHEEFDVVQLQVPYIPGFLAFREAPILLGLLEKLKRNVHNFYPQLLMVDGNGLLHPRGAAAKLDCQGGKCPDTADCDKWCKILRDHRGQHLPVAPSRRSGGSELRWREGELEAAGRMRARARLDRALLGVDGRMHPLGILVIAVLIVAVLSSSGSAKYVCRGKCSDFPDCNNWCKTAGNYPKGGQCVPPLYQYCCCIQ